MIPDHLILIKSPVIQTVKVQDNGERMVELASYAKERGSALVCEETWSS